MMTRRILHASAVCILLAACSKDPVVTVVEEPVNKKVTYQVFAGKDYSAPIYDPVTAFLRLSVSAVDLKSGVSTPVWDTAYGVKPIRSFPQVDQKWQVEKVFPIIESVEKLTVSYTITYDNSGQQQQAFKFETVPKGVSSFLMPVEL